MLIYSFRDLLQLALGGVANGSVYALVALAFHVVFYATGVINFAQGEQVVLAGLLAFTMFVIFKLPLAVGFLLAIGISSLLALLFERGVLRHAMVRGEAASIIATVGAGIAVKATDDMIWGKTAQPFPNFMDQLPFSLLQPVVLGGARALMNSTGAAVNPVVIWVVASSVVVVALVYVFFRRTRWGQAMQAASMNPTAAKLVGINTQAVNAAAWGISGAVAAVAGLLAGPLTYAGGPFGIELGVKGFSAAIVGGLTNPVGAVLGGYLVGLIEAFGAGTVSSQYRDAFAFGVMLLVLLIRPAGLFGKREITKV